MTLHVERKTPTQIKSNETRRRFADGIASRAHRDTPVECLSASDRSGRLVSTQKPPAFVPTPRHYEHIEPVDPGDVPHPPLTIRLWIEPFVAKRPNVRQIQRAVSRHFFVEIDDLLLGGRTKGVVMPRQIAMYLATKLTVLSSTIIGQRFGGRDHTTVLHAERKISAKMLKDMKLKEDVDAIGRLILGAGR
jgi:hypothetical protein